jgi:hypothetical protein
MSKNAIFYFVKYNSDHAFLQFKYLLESKNDIFVFTSGANTLDKEQYKGAKEIFIYNQNLCKYTVDELNNFSMNKFKIMDLIWNDNKSLFQTYEHIFFIEPIFRYSRKLTDLFKTLENDKSDYLSAYVQHLTNETFFWRWYDKFKTLYDTTKYPNVLKAYDGGFTRISIKGLNFLMESNDTLLDYFIDLSFATVLYNNGFKIKSLSHSETDDEFLGFNLCEPSLYYYNTTHKIDCPDI